MQIIRWWKQRLRALSCNKLSEAQYRRYVNYCYANTLHTLTPLSHFLLRRVGIIKTFEFWFWQLIHKINYADNTSLSKFTTVYCHDHRFSKVWLHIFFNKISGWNCHSATPDTNVFYPREGKLHHKCQQTLLSGANYNKTMSALCLTCWTSFSSLSSSSQIS